MSVVRRRAALAALLVLFPATACLPYTVGTSAQTVPANESTRSVSSYFAPNAVKLDDSVAAPMFDSTDLLCWRTGWRAVTWPISWPNTAASSASLLR